MIHSTFVNEFGYESDENLYDYLNNGGEIDIEKIKDIGDKIAVNL